MHTSFDQLTEPFTQISKHFYSNDPLQQRYVLSEKFSALAESLVFDLRTHFDDLDGMLAFILNGTKQSRQATLGVWVAIGVASAHPGARQALWIELAGLVLAKASTLPSLWEWANTMKSGFKMTLSDKSISNANTDSPKTRLTLSRLLQPSVTPASHREKTYKL